MDISYVILSTNQFRNIFKNCIFFYNVKILLIFLYIRNINNCANEI